MNKDKIPTAEQFWDSGIAKQVKEDIIKDVNWLLSMEKNKIPTAESADWQIRDYIFKLVNNNCKEIPWEGTEVDKAAIKQEFIETRKMIELLWKSRKGQLSEQEIEQIKGQSLDVVRLIFLGAIFAIPFSGIFIIMLVKGANKIGIRLMPSAFSKK